MGVDAVIAQGGEGGGHTGTGAHVAAAARRWSTRSARAIPVLGAGGFYDGRGPRRRPRLRRRRHRHGHPLPAHPGEPRARRREGRATSAASVYRHRRHHRPRRRPAAGDPHRRRRPHRAQPRSCSASRAPPSAALRFRKETGTSLARPRARGPGHAAQPGPHAGARWRMAANAPMLIKATMVDGKPEVGILPTGQVDRRDRRAADRGRAARPHPRPRPSADAEAAGRR